jgi:DNA-binding IclR family transcriptional regulator
MIQQSSTDVAVPADLNSPRAKLVFLYLSTHEGATIGELQENLAMKKIALYSILKTLRERGLVGQETDRYVLA